MLYTFDNKEKRKIVKCKTASNECITFQKNLAKSSKGLELEELKLAIAASSITLEPLAGRRKALRVTNRDIQYRITVAPCPGRSTLPKP